MAASCGESAGVAVGGHADGLGDLLGGAVLHQVARRAGPDGVGEHLLVGVHREHDAPGSSVPVARIEPGGLHAVHLGHRHVHQDDVGLELGGQAHGLLAVVGLADDVEALVGQRAAQALAQHAVVVGQQHSDRHAASTSGRRCLDGSACRAVQRTRVPLPGSASTARVAPMLAARSRMPRMP